MEELGRRSFSKAEVRSQELGAKKAVSIQIRRFPGKPIQYKLGGQGWLTKELDSKLGQGCENDRQTNVFGLQHAVGWRQRYVSCLRAQGRT